MNAPEFFYQHAGTSYPASAVGNPAEQDWYRWAGAVELSVAELWLSEHGHVRWEDDWRIGSHIFEYDCYESEPDTCEVAFLYDDDGTCLGSLGCVDDATYEYRRVIAAELADEAMYNYINECAERYAPVVVFS